MLATPSVLLTTAEMFVQLTLSHLRLRCVVSLSFSKSSGLAMVFRDDPLESLNVSSSFDSFGVVQQFIQSVGQVPFSALCLSTAYTDLHLLLQEIENQLRERFRRDLPSLIHRLSQRWCADMAQQSSALDSHDPVVVEQVIHTPGSENGPTSYREPDDSLPYDYRGDPIRSKSRANSRSFSESPSKDYFNRGGDGSANEEAIQFGLDDSYTSDSQEEKSKQSIKIGVETSRSSSYSSLSNEVEVAGSPGGDASQPSSWSSTWSRETPYALDSQSPPRRTPTSPMNERVRRQSGTDSPIINSLKRSTSNFATTFSKPPVPVSAQDLRESLDGLEGPTDSGNRVQNRRNRLKSQSGHTALQRSESQGTPEEGEARVPFATRKRFHRLEGSTPKTTPNSSPHKSRTLKGAKSRDRLRVRREDLDEYFPVTEEGSSTTTTANDNVFTSNRTHQPSLLNPHVPMQVPMAASFKHSSNSEVPSKNSLRRTIMSSRLRELERLTGTGGSSGRRQTVDRNFFTANDYR